MADAPPTRFSVIMPLYNKERFVRASLTSALAQEHAACEIVLVDDGSTDGSTAAVADLIGGGVRVIRQRNAGPGAARNRGIAETRHEWVALLDADDLWLPDHLATLADLIAQFPPADLVASGFRRVGADAGTGAAPRPSAATAGYVLDFFRERSEREAVWSSAVAMRRSAFLATPGFGDNWPGEDSAFWAEFALDHQIAVTRKVTALYRVETGGIMHTGRTSEHERTDVTAAPFLAVLDRTLADPRYQAHHADIAKLRQVTLLTTARRALFRGDDDRARRALAELSGPPGRTARAYRLLAGLPSPLRRAAIAGYRLVKRVAGQTR